MSWVSLQGSRVVDDSMIEQAVSVFEPRISRIKVVLARILLRAPSMCCDFRSKALLEMDPAPELITFDTVLQLSSGEYQVSGEPGA